jgi:hypothetical protein
VPRENQRSGRLSFVNGQVLHLWHGDLENRKYAQRHEELGRFGAEPVSDVVLDPSGCWGWNRSKSQMHK